ncbi:MAG TPA: GGDEF domain-containing protein, partial [Catenuloplanes sp.]
MRRPRLPRSREGRRMSRPTGILVALAVSYVVALAIAAASWGVDGRAMDSKLGPFMAVYGFVAAVCAVRAGWHPKLDARSRRGWRLMAVAFAMLAVSCVLFALTELQPFPTVADGARLLFIPVMLAGLLILPARAPTAADGYKIALDICTVVAGSAMLLWWLVLGAVLTGRDAALVTAVAAAYPIGDLALIFGAANILFRTASPRTRRPLLLVVAAVMMFVVGDIYLGYQQSHDTAGSYLGWQFLSWLTAHFLLAVAAAEQCRRANDHRAERAADQHFRRVPRLPYAAVLGGYVVLLVVALRLPLHPFGGLVIGAMVMTGLVLARQIVALRENHKLAVTDSLTGLANRALLRQELSRALDRARRSATPVAVLLIDLNGFKEINDTLGHEAGDEMLVAFAQLLQRNVRQYDLVARLGGDEFAIVLHTGDPTNAAQRIAAAMDTPVPVAGQWLRPRASIGVAVSDPAGCTASELLHEADTDMYRVKRSER